MASRFEELFRLCTTLSDPGHTRFREDGLRVTELPGAVFAIVLDGVSGLYTGSPTLVDGFLSGGEAVARTVERVFASIQFPVVPLENVLLAANSAVRDEVAAHFCADNAVRPGATFAAAKITASHIRLIIGGDCVAAWLYADRTVGASHNQIREHDRILDAGHEQDMRDALAELQACGNRAFFDDLGPGTDLYNLGTKGGLTLEQVPEAVVENHIRPIMRRRSFSLDGPVAEARRRDVNNYSVKDGYALLNGETGVASCWQEHHLVKKDVKTLILCSDGLITREVYMNQDDLAAAEFLFEHYAKGGLPAVRRAVETWEDAHSQASYVSRTERVGIAFEF